jgi:hypothetical protein
MGPSFIVGSYASFGSRVVLTGPPDRRPVYLADLDGGSLVVLGRAARGYSAWGVDISGNHAVWIEGRYAEAPDRVPCAVAGELSWRIMLADLNDGETVEVASGVQRHVEWCTAASPIVRIDGGRLTYAVEHPRPDHPLGWRISLLSLGTLEVERRLDTDRDLQSLALTGTTIAYVEGEQDEVGANQHTRLMLSTAEQPEPAELAAHAYDVQLAGQRLLWLEDRQQSLGEDAFGGAPIALSATLDDLAPVDVPVGTWGQRTMALGDGVVSWSDEDGLSLWPAEDARAVGLVPTYGAWWSAGEGGWLTWLADVDAESDGYAQLYGLPFTALPLPATSP